MTTIALIIQPLVLLAAFALVLRHVTRANDEHTDALHALTRATLDHLQHQADAHRAEVADLLQRIQAPEVAVAQHVADTSPPADTYPLSENEQAEAQDAKLAAQTALEMIRAHESEMAVA